MRKLTGWVKNLKRPEKVLLVIGVLILFALANGSGQDQKTLNVNPASDKNQSTSQSKPKTTTKTVTETQSIPFGSSTVNDANLDKGKTQVTTTGVNGTRTLTYKITYKNGKQTGKQLLNSEVTTPPINQVTSVGTYSPPPPQQPKCDPNYSGACVPIASDVDCAGGSGNGPAYVSGPVYVVGSDIYGLDRDGDGVACE